jgi:hypothetical protein
VADTANNRRFLQQEGGELVATVRLQVVVDAYAALEEDGTPISISVLLFSEIQLTDLVAVSGPFVSEEVG